MSKSKQIKRSFNGMTDRYAFDRECSCTRGWAQVDTRQDAPYFGLWTNPFSFKILTYCEGDITEETYATDEEYREELIKTLHFESYQLFGRRTALIDPGWPDIECTQALQQQFKLLNLTEFLH